MIAYELDDRYFVAGNVRQFCVCSNDQRCSGAQQPMAVRNPSGVKEARELYRSFPIMYGRDYESMNQCVCDTVTLRSVVHRQTPRLG